MNQENKLSEIRDHLMINEYLSTIDHPQCCYHAARLRIVLGHRERELLELKGPCSNKQCRLHYAHSGPCDTSAENGDTDE